MSNENSNNNKVTYFSVGENGFELKVDQEIYPYVKTECHPENYYG